MEYSDISRQILVLAGGKENISSTEACMTRLRLGIVDISKADIEGIKKINGVLSVVKSDTLQIVFGPGTVNKVLEAFRKILEDEQDKAKGSESSDFGNDSIDTFDSEPDDISEKSLAQEECAEELALQNKVSQLKKYDRHIQNSLKHIANIFVPLLPGIIAAGLINGITNIINVAGQGGYNGAWWYECIRTMGWAMFAYLPMFVGFNSAREFGGTPILGGLAGAMCIANVSMPLLSQYGGSDVILPMTNAAYNPSHGGLIAALIAGGVFAVFEREIRKRVPVMLDTFLTPLLVLILGAIAMVTIIQPVSAILTNLIYVTMDFAYGKMGILGGYILSAGFLPLVATGLHQALKPIHVMLNDPTGPTKGIDYLLPVLMMAGGGQVGSGLALYFKTKNKHLKKLIHEAIPVGILGVGEPLMYAVTLPLGRSFITACLGAGFGGIAATLFHIGTDTQGVSGLFGLLVVEPGQQLQYVIALSCAYLGGFVLTWFFGVDENRINEIYGKE